MIRNYLLIALRNFQRQKLFTLLNMFGLAMGIASAILIFLYVSEELQYDDMHPFPDDTYRIGTRFTNPDGRIFSNIVSPGIFVKRLKDTRSEVIDAARIDYIGYPTSLHHKEQDKIILTEEIRWAEPGFDRILSFELLKGSREKMFGDHNTMVVSENGARKLFGDKDPIGEIVSVKHTWATREREIDVMVTGVYRNFPSNSHFKPQFIINVNAFRAIHESFDEYMEGASLQNSNFFESYVVFRPGTDIEAVESDLRNIARQITGSDSGFVAAGWEIDVFTKKLSDLHFDRENIWEQPGGTAGDMEYLAIFGAVAVLILLIACINYMNLATARSARRAREVGLRKSFGSERSEIARQFFYESAVTTIGSLIIALLLVLIFMGPFNQLAHKTFTLASLLNPYMIAVVLLVVLFMTFVSGSYPAIYLSGFRPSEVLKGQAIKGSGAEFFRKTLVTIQYTVSLVLIISTVVIIGQMDELQTTKLNEQGSQLLSIRYGGIAPQNRFAAFKEALLQDSDIEHVTMANHLPRLNYFGWIGTTVKFPELQEKELQWSQLNVDFDFARTYGLEFVAGRDFMAGNLADSSSMILNETAARALNQPVDQIIGASVTDVSSGRSFTVIGVVRDFPYRSMHQVIEPLILNPHVHFVDRIVYVKLPPGKFQEKLQFIEATWKRVLPNVGFDYWFVSDEFNRMYVAENRVSSLARSFAMLAVLITVLGVFGLASYTAERKTKEVGIRKVLGAAVMQVVGMFLMVFFKIFLVASLIAVPLAWYLADHWLESFAYRYKVSPLIFLLSLLGLLMTTILTVGYETWKAARSNPVHSLRSE